MANLQAFERSEYQQVKADLHRKILDRLDLEKLGKSTGEAARAKLSDWLTILKLRPAKDIHPHPRTWCKL